MIGTCALALARGLEQVSVANDTYSKSVLTLTAQNGISYTIFERDSKEDYYNKTRDWGAH